MGRTGHQLATNSPPEDTSNDERENRTKRVHDQPRKSSRQEKGKGIASSNQPDPPRRSRSSNAQWPRRDGIPFPGIDIHPKLGRKDLVSESSYRKKRQGDGWVRYHSICYNGLLNVKMSPTRVLCPTMLDKLGIKDETLAFLERMGIGTMATYPYPLYPELVRQFLASCEVYYPAAAPRTVARGCLTYVLRGVEYEISLRDLCALYGFDEGNTSPEFPERRHFRQCDQFWNLIGSGPATSRSMKLTLIRNPIIRLVAKALSTTLFCKEEPGAVRLDELYLLHLGMPEFVSDFYDERPRESTTNFGAVFAHFLTERKFRGLAGPGTSTSEVCGSLLTPIFRFHQIDTSGTAEVLTPSLLDMSHLTQSRWMVDGRWRYFDLDGVQRSISLPSAHALLTSMDNVRFLPTSSPSPEQGAPVQRRKRRHVSRDTAGTSSGTAQPEERYQLPPYQDQFAISPPRDTWPEHTHWQYRSFQKLHNMMSTIWGAISCSRGTDAVGGSDFAGSRMPPPSGPSDGPSTDPRSEDDDDAAGTDEDETMVSDESPAV